MVQFGLSAKGLAGGAEKLHFEEHTSSDHMAMKRGRISFVSGSPTVRCLRFRLYIWWITWPVNMVIPPLNILCTAGARNI
jgi:hypothetical protein